MLNVQALTQTLSAMPLNQLQQYAQLHRNDPYVVTMALSIANQKKQAMTAQQGQAGQQPQPKVVDSEIAQMAPQQMPEDQGIGQLPAGNMDFADGGIVGYADGGHVERYAGGGELLRTTTGGKSWFLDVPSTMRDPSVPYYREIPSPFVGLADKQFASKEEALAAYNQLAQPAAPKTTPTYSPADYSGMDRRIMSGSQQPTISSISPPAVTAAPIADNTRRAAPGAAPVAGPKQPAQAGLGDLATLRQNILNKQSYTDPASAGLEELEARELAAAQDDKAALLRDQDKFSEAFKGREKRLSDRELDIGKQKDTSTGLAFLNAGLAIMSTPGGLATAIGKGAQVGTAQFAAGLDKIRSAQERLADARDKLEDLQLNRAEMSAKEIRAAEKSIRNVGIDAQKRTIDGIRAAANVTEARATDIYKSTVQVGVAGMEIQGRKEAAQIAAGPGYERNQMLKMAQNNENKQRATQQAEFGKLQAKVMDTLSKDANYQTANPTMQSVMYTNALRQAVSSNPFLATHASGIGFSSAPTGKVYDLTTD